MTLLKDIRILAIEQYGAGPYGSLQLADLGADVIRIEQGAGDVARAVQPFSSGEDSLFYQAFNRNKRGIALDIQSVDGRRVFHELVAHSDAVYSNLRGDVVGKLKLRYENLAPYNPRIVCCSLSGYGMTGPRVAEPAYDYMIQAVAGWMALTGEPDGIPTKSGLSVVDFASGLAASAALLAGVHAARRDGVGCDCDVSLFDTAISMLNYVGTWQATGGYETERQSRSAHPTMAPFQAFETSNGWIVAGGTKDKFWTLLATALDRKDLLGDPRFVRFPDRLQHRAELIVELDRTFATGTTEFWIGRLTEAGVPCGRVNTVAEALAEPQALARGSIVHTKHETLGTIRSIASAVRAGPARVNHHRAPHIGEHTAEVLRGVLGYSEEKVQDLVEQGVVALAPVRPEV